MKKITLAAIAMFAVIGNASATNDSNARGTSSYASEKSAQAASQFHNGDVKFGAFRTDQSRKSKQQVMRELEEHRERMRSDRAYAEEWRSMYEN